MPCENGEEAVKAAKSCIGEAIKFMPAGVNSPVRAFKAVEGSPLYMQRGEGAYIHDVDGKQYMISACLGGR